ncbi:MAG: hypothetical protein QM503_03120 [Bacteroidota bacterium]
MGGITLITVGILLVISYEDFTYRLIHWYYFPLVAGLLLLQKVQQEQLYASMINIGVNLLIIIFMLLMTTLIYSARRGKLVLIIDNAIGKADILVFIILCISLSPINLVLFMLLSFLVAILFQILTYPFTNNARYIPLAGIISTLLSVALILQEKYPFINLTNDFQTLGAIGHIYF